MRCWNYFRRHGKRGKVRRSSLNSTYTIDQKQQITPTAPVFDLVDTVGNSPSLRLVGKLSWSLRGWTVQSTVNYTGAYRDPASVPVRNGRFLTTVDRQYRLPGRRRLRLARQYPIQFRDQQRVPDQRAALRQPV